MLGILVWIHLGFLAKNKYWHQTPREGVNPSSGHASSRTPLGLITCPGYLLSEKDCLLAKPQPFGDRLGQLLRKLCDRSDLRSYQRGCVGLRVHDLRSYQRGDISAAIESMDRCSKMWVSSVPKQVCRRSQQHFMGGSRTAKRKRKIR